MNRRGFRQAAGLRRPYARPAVGAAGAASGCDGQRSASRASLAISETLGNSELNWAVR